MKLYRTITTAFVLGAFLLLVPHETVKADYTCDIEYNDGSYACAYQYVDCINDYWFPSVCRPRFDLCNSWNIDAFHDCDWINGPSANPWPVIDFHLQWCLEGCNACDDIENFTDRFNCRNECMTYCYQVYPKP